MKFTAYFTTGASIAVSIEADTAEEAQDKADDFDDFPSLCAQCSGWGRDVGIDLGDWEQDGEVQA